MKSRIPANVVTKIFDQLKPSNVHTWQQKAFYAKTFKLSLSTFKTSLYRPLSFYLCQELRPLFIWYLDRIKSCFAFTFKLYKMCPNDNFSQTCLQTLLCHLHMCRFELNNTRQTLSYFWKLLFWLRFMTSLLLNSLANYWPNYLQILHLFDGMFVT